MHFSNLSDGLNFAHKHYDSRPLNTCDVPRQSGGPTQDMDEFGKVGAEMSYLQSQMHSDFD